MAERVVVMGGSFNPPTIAHWLLMRAALDVVDARVGYFVPVSFAYLKRKMVRAGQGHLSLPDDLRVDMLRAMAASDERLRVYTDVMDRPFSNDCELMGRIQEAHPGSTAYGVFGADKLGLLEHFATDRDFFGRYGCVFFAREGERLDAGLVGRDLCARNADALVFASAPAEAEGISSTRVRDHLFDIDAVADMLHPSVVPMLRGLRREDFPEEVIQFRGDFAFLSNDYAAEVDYDGITYPCAASAFLASKFKDRQTRLVVSRMRPDRAKQKYGASVGDAEWEGRRLSTMEKIVRSKFSQHPDLARELAETDGLRLIAGEKKKRPDTFWGVDIVRWEGQNHLGRILMQLREE